MKNRIDTIILCSNHAGIIGHIPAKLTAKEVCNKIAMERSDTSSFGLFDTATPNFNTYFPEVKAEDLKPDLDKEAFIYPLYRALSEVIVHKSYNPVDFALNGALRKSEGMLIGQTIYANHEMGIGNELGAIVETLWQDGYKTSNGILVPSGINARLKIDGKANPKIARGMMMEPPSIHSVSVTVSFGWEPSHKFATDNDFYSKIGTYASDGQLVRRIVTEVKNYHEISLVAHGADPFAQKIGDNGHIVNPSYADRVSNAAKGEKVKPYVFAFDYKVDLISNASKEAEDAKIATILENSNNKNQATQHMKDYLLKLALTFAIATEGLDDAALQSKIEAAITAQSNELKNSKDASGKSYKELYTTADAALKNADGKKWEDLYNSAKPVIDAHEAHVTKLRETTVANYKKLAGDRPDAAILATLGATNEESLAAFNAQYTTSLEEKFPLQCESCHSDKVSRKTSASDPGTGGSKKTVKLSDADAAAEFVKGSRNSLTFIEAEKEQA